MTKLLKTFWPAAFLTGFLMGLGLILPGVNAASGPPHAVFHQLDPSQAEPIVDLSVTQGQDGRWTLWIRTRHFEFTPVCQVVSEPVPLGHAHVIKGDTKIASAFQPWVTLGHLDPGEHSFRVVLRGQDHRALMGVSGLISADLTVTVPPHNGT